MAVIVVTTVVTLEALGPLVALAAGATVLVLLLVAVSLLVVELENVTSVAWKVEKSGGIVILKGSNAFNELSYCSRSYYCTLTICTAVEFSSDEVAFNILS